MEFRNDSLELKRRLRGIDKGIRYLSEDKSQFITLMYAIQGLTELKKQLESRIDSKHQCKEELNTMSFDSENEEYHNMKFKLVVIDEEIEEEKEAGIIKDEYSYDEISLMLGAGTIRIEKDNEFKQYTIVETMYDINTKVMGICVKEIKE